METPRPGPLSIPIRVLGLVAWGLGAAFAGVLGCAFISDKEVQLLSPCIIGVMAGAAMGTVACGLGLPRVTSSHILIAQPVLVGIAVVIPLTIRLDGLECALVSVVAIIAIGGVVQLFARDASDLCRLGLAAIIMPAGAIVYLCLLKAADSGDPARVLTWVWKLDAQQWVGLATVSMLGLAGVPPRRLLTRG